MKYRVDSLEKQVIYQAQYINGIKKVLNGDAGIKLDTMAIQVPKEEITND